MLPEIIRDHSPMDDYKIMQSQIKYSIQYAPNTNAALTYSTDEFSNSKPYTFSYKLMIHLFILTGIGILASVLFGLICSPDSFSDTERKIFTFLIFITFTAFFSALLIAGCGSFIEMHIEKKSKELNISLDSKTWILKNGQIVISDEQSYFCVQQYDYKTRLPISDAPFKKCIIIQKIYSITRNNGKIIADAYITELYRKHPYVNEYPTQNAQDDSDRYYYYCKRYKRNKIIWYENMYGRELLLDALHQLQYSKN